MRITRRSLLTGRVSTRDLPITERQFQAWYAGVLVQVAFPRHSPDEREFLMTGVTPQEWDAFFPAEQENDHGRA